MVGLGAAHDYTTAAPARWFARQPTAVNLASGSRLLAHGRGLCPAVFPVHMQKDTISISKTFELHCRSEAPSCRCLRLVRPVAHARQPAPGRLSTVEWAYT